MRKYTLLIAILFITTIGVKGYSQQTNLTPDLLSFPVSPEVAKMVTYGNVPVNLFSGQLNNTIQLFAGKQADFNVSVDLRYNYAGNRPEESPSIIGLGWQLSVGGVITREVRGLPDEHPRGYYNAAVQSILNNYFVNENMLFPDAVRFANGYYDSQVDAYHVSVNGINFSFKIGVDGTPVYLSKHNYKIDINKDLNNPNKVESFVLTDTNSNKYLFSEKEVNEPFDGYGSSFDENFMSYTSSWQLSKIIVNNGQEINFGYEVNDFMSYNFYSSLLFRLADDVTLQFLGLERSQYNEGCTRYIIKRKILKSIASPTFNIDFSYVKLNDHEVYNNISIRDMHHNNVIAYNFNYSGYRNFLDSITKNGEFFYSFEYSGGTSSLPEFSNSTTNYPRNQDEWGFANGANNTHSLSYTFAPIGTSYHADRTPSFDHTVKGALTLIKYPTGGRTQIFYEQNSFKPIGDGRDPNTRINLKFKSDNVPSAPLSKEKVFTKTFESDVEAVLSHYISNINFIDMSIKRIDIVDSPINQVPYYISIPSVRSLTGINRPIVPVHLYETAMVDNNCMSFNNCAKSKTSEGIFILPAGTYEFKIRTDYNRTQDVNASITMDFYDLEVDIHTQEGTLMPFGGIRVKRIVDVPYGGIPVEKNYDYVGGRKLDDPYLINKKFIKETVLVDVAPYSQFQFQIPFYPNVVEVSAKALNLILKNNVPIFYSQVIEYTNRNETYIPEPFFCHNCGGNFGGNWDSTPVYSYLNGVYGVKKYIYPEGYKLTTFNAPRLTYTDFPFTPTGNDLSLGAVKSNITYSKNTIATDNDVLTEEHNSYFHFKLWEYLTLYPNPNYPKSMLVDYKVKILGPQHLPPNFTIDQFFHFKIYKELDSESYINFKNVKEHFDDKVVEKQISIEYDDHFQQHLITTTDSGGSVLTNELFYPYNFDDAISDQMVSKNYISAIVKIENKKDGVPVDSYKYDFGVIGANLFKPFFFLKSKGDSLLEKKMWYDYDLKGNIIQIGDINTNIGGSVIPYTINNKETVIWGYNNSQPIAKIENASYSSINPNLITAIQNATDSPTITEENLIIALNALRTALPNAMVTTFTYKPLVGVSTITDPKGMTTYYEYDSFGRLKTVKDANGNILSENQYHYRP